MEPAGVYCQAGVSNTTPTSLFCTILSVSVKWYIWSPFGSLIHNGACWCVQSGWCLKHLSNLPIFQNPVSISEVVQMGTCPWSLVHLEPAGLYSEAGVSNTSPTFPRKMRRMSSLLATRPPNKWTWRLCRSWMPMTTLWSNTRQPCWEKLQMS